MNWTEDKIREVYGAAMRAAVTDEEFRGSLLEDPKGAVEKLTGVSLPEEFRLKVLEEDPECDLAILLPPMLSDELTAEETEQVAGGFVNRLQPGVPVMKQVEDAMKGYYGK